MKVLHVASFIGNIGDNASHKGFNNILKSFFPEYSINQLEIRKFYKNYNQPDKKYFDESFIQYANKFDLLVIGGGGFLDYWVKDSATGTTLDIEPALLCKINIPTLITSVGCKSHRDLPPGNIEKFRYFLDCAFANPKIKIAVRNDGSILSLKNTIGQKYADQIPEVLDSGFFYDVAPATRLPLSRDYISINITHDQIHMHGSESSAIDPENYYKQLGLVIKFIILEKNLDVVLVPHIYSDLVAISTLLEKLDDFLIREHITVAPCIQGDDGADYIFSIYQKSTIVLGTRLHANICSMTMGKPSIGLVALGRIKYVYDYFGLSEQYVLLEGEFSSDLINKISKTINDKDALGEKLLLHCQQEKKRTLLTYHTFFNNAGFDLI